MDWITIVVIAAIVFGLCLFQYFSNAGANIICIKPRDKAKGNRQKNIQTVQKDDSDPSGSGE